eukprot:gnl/Spiro4/23027_TR11374_c0_g1_i1.p1 gnl/Spiro4/23027_TR11374_c0_g1~~gnl/Spiro4/23027_TR11374_c0_g1_i1.p1  ORF type:complete len:207 (+),score=24.18 gnl/Spiro4/23027_TR11374_c0_g1_i1:30-650(+)
MSLRSFQLFSPDLDISPREIIVPISVTHPNGPPELLFWNPLDRSVTIHSFARLLCKEVGGFPSVEYVSAMVSQQIQSFERVPPSPDEQKLLEIQLDIADEGTGIVLRDRFLYDPHCPLNSPEQFAHVLCADMGLPPPFTVKIAHAIRTQVLEYARRSRAAGGTPVAPAAMCPSPVAPAAVCPPPVAVRPPHELASWTPRLHASRCG